ncbi:MAG TPA: TonB-dependent receptor [Burkholderiaceae bacterium]|nr:TonB-dependent receptor [Burkholderiaceae bacterium]
MKNNLDVVLGGPLWRVFVICVATCWNGSAHAQLASLATPLQEVVVSGSRTEATLEETGSAVTILTSSELEQRQVRLVSDALRAVPGIAVSRQGPAGTVTQVRIRGAEANHTVVLIDGIKINDPFTSEVDFAHLLTAQIDRIEILRGPQSVLYGSEAIGGVISIFTKRGTPGVQADVALEGGSFSSIDGSAALRGATATLNYALSASALRTDGTNVSRFGSEDDGYRNGVLYARAGWAPTSATELNASLRYRNSRSMFDPQDFTFPPGPTFGLIVDGDRRSEGDQLDARLRGRLITGALEHQLGFTHTQTQEDTFADGMFTNGFEGRRDRFDYQGTWRFGGNLPQALTLAAEHERQRFESKGPTPASPQSQTRENDKTGVAAEYRARLPWLTALTLSVRRDQHELFADATTYRITAAQPLGSRVKLRASYGTAIANPTFFELFGFIPGSFDPNPDLKPEKSRGFDVGADFAIAAQGRLSVTYFDADLENEISTTFDASSFRSSVANLDGKSKRRGLEVEAQYAPSDTLTVWVMYTYTDSRQPDGQIEVRRPRHVGSAALTYAPRSAFGSLTLAVDYNGRQEDLDFRQFTSARVSLRDYALVRLAAQYNITGNVSLTARVENLLDQDYEEIFSYRPSGRAFYAGVQARF